MEVCMSRDITGDLPRLSLEGGYVLRPYRDGDEKSWFSIHRRVEIYDPLSEDLFTREFGMDARALAERQVYLCDASGGPVGTATAWFPGPGRDSAEGRVHWVAVVPEHQRRGLGRYLTVVACERLRHLGSLRAYLTTGAANVAAVQLYLGLGFAPEVKAAADSEAWRHLADRLDSKFRRAVRAGLQPGPS